jgi:hypothetical protein
VAGLSTDAVGRVGAVDEEASRREAQRVRAERIVRAGRHPRRHLGILAPYRRGRIPGGVDDLAHDGEGAEGRLPFIHAHPDRERERFPAGFRQEVEPHLRDVHQERPPHGGSRQDPRRGDDQGGAGDGDEGIDPGVGGGDGVEADVVLPGHLDERLASLHDPRPDDAEDLLVADVDVREVSRGEEDAEEQFHLVRSAVSTVRRQPQSPASPPAQDPCGRQVSSFGDEWFSSRAAQGYPRRAPRHPDRGRPDRESSIRLQRCRRGRVIRARLLARSETPLPRRRRPRSLARRAHRPARDVRR